MALTAEVVNLEENRVRLDVEVPEDEVQKRMDRAIRQLGREVRVPGFRPGKAPAEAIGQRVGRDAVVQEMLKGSLGEWYSQAVAETGVQPIDDPDLDLESVPEEGDLTFQAVVQVNEASLSFLVKLACVAAVLVAMGATLSGSLAGYARRCFGGIEHVVR